MQLGRTLGESLREPPTFREYPPLSSMIVSIEARYVPPHACYNGHTHVPPHKLAAPRLQKCPESKILASLDSRPLIV